MTCCPQTLKAIVFDFDGTLAETNIDFAEMRRRIYELIHQWGLWEDHMGDGRYVLEVIDAAKAKLAADPERQSEFDRQAAQVLVDVEMETVANAAPYPGVVEALDRLVQSGYKLGIVTRNCRECVEHFLARHPLPCEVCLTRDDVQLVKPDPAHLLAALERLAVDPAEAIMVGDHRSDIECGQAAGCCTVGVFLTGTTAAQFAQLGANAAYEDVPAFVAALCGDKA
ncbi:MAG: HAD family hydrolase [Armatimonadia bacterium]